MQTWERVEPTTATKVGWRTIVTKSFHMPDGATAQFDTYDTEGRIYVAVIAVTAEGRVVVARQFRAGPEKVCDEIPGGGVEPEEAHEDAVRRELLEEIGYASDSVEYLGYVHKDEKFNAVHHYFLATGCYKVTDQQQLDKDEYVTPALVSIGDFIENAQNGKMTDAGAVLLAYDKLRALAAEQNQNK